MARVTDIEIDNVPVDVQPIYRRYAEEYGPFLNQVKVFAHRPAAVKHIMGLLLDLADEKVLPKRYLEIVLVVVSKLNECDYCVAHHQPRLVEQGFDLETAAKILQPDCPGLNATERLVRDYAIQVSNDPNRIRDQLFDQLRAAFSEEQIVELTLRIALCGFFNRFNDALQIAPEEEVISDFAALDGVVKADA